MRFEIVLPRSIWLMAGVTLAACDPGLGASAPFPGEPVAAWEPVDARFAGCQGACGARAEGPSPEVVAQPGASLGQHTYCPVSGAVFEVEADRPHAEVDSRRLWFCCAGCAAYFEEHRDEVLHTRGISTGSVTARGQKAPPGS